MFTVWATSSCWPSNADVDMKHDPIRTSQRLRANRSKPFNPLIGFWRYGAAISWRADVVPGPWLSIGRQSKISSFVTIRSSGGAVSIGAETDVGVSSVIDGGRYGITIGRDCLISPHCRIVEARTESEGPIRIGDNVWIGAGAAVSNHAFIGDGVIIAPNSVVHFDIPANAIVQGNPAKVIFIRR